MTDTEPVPGDHPFATVMRGYDRRQVDGFVAGHTARIAALETELADAQRLRLRAVRRAEELEQELRDARDAVQPEGAGFGVRAEKIIRLAEQEAAEVRADAARDAAALLERARTDAEAHRHDVEQALADRQVQFESRVAERIATLEEKEQRAAEILAAAREEGAGIAADAADAADRTRLEAETAAAEILENADAELTQQRTRVEQEIERLTGMQTDVRADLARLAGALASELAGREES